jgi:hypothetical protein
MNILVVTGANGMVTKSLKKNLEAISGQHPTELLHKAAVLGTSHTNRKVLQSETGSQSGGHHRWFKRSTREKRL